MLLQLHPCASAQCPAAPSKRLGLACPRRLQSLGVFFAPTALWLGSATLMALLWIPTPLSGLLANVALIYGPSLYSPWLGGCALFSLAIRTATIRSTREIAHEQKGWAGFPARVLAAKHPDNVMTIRYEDFLDDQEAVLRKVCTFFGIDFMPEMLEIDQSAEARDISKMSALWETNYKAPVRDNIDKYKRLLTTDEIRTIESVCHDLMAVYGYKRDTDGIVEQLPELLEQAKGLSDYQRRIAWSNLKEINPKDYILRQARKEHISMVQTRLTEARQAPFTVYDRLANKGTKNARFTF